MKTIRTQPRPRIVLVTLTSLALASAAYAFTASNTVPASKAGAGSGTISGYTVTGVKYNLDATDPAKIDSVEFDLDAAAGTVKAKVISASTSYTDCTASGTHFTCDFSTNPTVTAADQLSVISVQ